MLYGDQCFQPCSMKTHMEGLLIVFSDILLDLNQSERHCNSLFNCLISVCKSFPLIIKHISSVYMIQKINLRHCVMSFMVIINNRGPKTKPCCTPHLTSLASHFIPSWMLP